MPRKVEIVQAPPSCKRDAGKCYQLTEWAAWKADHWAIKAMLAYNRGGGDLPGGDALIGRGMEAIFFIGIQTFLRGQIRSEEAIPILDELLECVEMVRDPKVRDVKTGGHIATPISSDDDIEEIETRWWLRSEVIKLHTGFSPAEFLSRWISAVMKGSPSKNIETPRQNADE